MQHTLYIHIDEDQNEAGIEAVNDALQRLPYVSHVEMSTREPHDVMVEFEANHDVPMSVLGTLGRCGLHSDVMSA